jgi:hypothetical protein
MKKNKTLETADSVVAFIGTVADDTKRSDCLRIVDLMKSQTGCEPKMWGPGIIGFGSCHYKYESGREGDMPLVAFAPRSAEIVFYLSANFESRAELLLKLGKHKTGKGCIYIKRLEDINIEILKELVSASFKHHQSLYF